MPIPPSPSPRGARAALWLVTLSVCGGALGCPASGGGQASANATSETSTPSSAESSTAPPPAPPPSDEVKGTGVTKVVAATADSTGCKSATFELASYLLRGELTVAGRASDKGSEFAASYLIQLQGKAQIAFAGYDGEAKRIARDRGIGSAREHAPHLFVTGDQWTVVWFDQEGLAFARPTWDTAEKPAIEHLSTLRNVEPANVALAATTEGPLVVASPFGTEGDQLSLFLFAPIAAGQRARAIGVTKGAKKPSAPAVLGDSTGYTVAWLEESGQLLTSRLDQEGKEQVSNVVVAKATKRDSLGLTLLDKGVLLTWAEEGQVFARSLDAKGAPQGPIQLIGKGKFPHAVARGNAAIVAFVGEAEGVADQLLAVRVSPDGPASEAVRVSDGKTAVLDPPAAALGGARLAFVWTEVMGAAISSKRAWIRVLDADCVK